MAKKIDSDKKILQKKDSMAQIDLTLKSKLVELIEADKFLETKLIDLIKSNNELVKEISVMVGFFKEAGERMVAESDEEKLKPLFEKLNALLEQNKTIVRGLLLIQKYIKASGVESESVTRAFGPEL